MWKIVGLVPAVILIVMAQSPTASVSMPDWLAAWPDTAVRLQQSAALVRSSYTAQAEPTAVVAYYRQQLKSAGLPFTSAFNGIGTSVRASAPECDLLIQISDDGGGGTSVTVNCASRTSGHQPARYASTQTARQPPSASQHPVRSVSNGPGLPTVYWPSWFDHMPGADRGLEVSVAQDSAGRKYMTSSFTISTRMQSVRDFYTARIKGAGYSEMRTSVATGDTMFGERQDATGYVEGVKYPNGKGNGKLKAHVSYHRTVLNGPITVELTVRATRR